MSKPLGSGGSWPVRCTLLSIRVVLQTGPNAEVQVCECAVTKPTPNPMLQKHGCYAVACGCSRVLVEAQSPAPARLAEQGQLLSCFSWQWRCTGVWIAVLSCVFSIPAHLHDFGYTSIFGLTKVISCLVCFSIFETLAAAISTHPQQAHWGHFLCALPLALKQTITILC
jgi:hypothetical protein